MKIILKDKVYIQLNDLSYLLKFMEGKPIPASVINSIFGEVFICTDDNRYEFREFKDEESMEFFSSLSYSVDYAELKDLSEQELMDKGIEVAKKINEVAHVFNSLDEDDRAHHQELVNEYEMLEFQMNSIRDFLWYKQGHIKMNIPSDVEPKVKKGLAAFFAKFKR